ncbi:hypothetical protein Tco_1409646 [Tanacetum coccineum]
MQLISSTSDVQYDDYVIHIESSNFSSYSLFLPLLVELRICGLTILPLPVVAEADHIDSDREHLIAKLQETEDYVVCPGCILTLTAYTLGLGPGFIFTLTAISKWECSSYGRALALHARGTGFDSL